MLVLTRKHNEVIVCGGADGAAPVVKITILEINNGKVRLGFEAAPDVPVHRLEVWERLRDRDEAVDPPDRPENLPRWLELL